MAHDEVGASAIARFIEVPFGDGWVASVGFVPDEDLNPIVGELRIYPHEPGRAKSPGEWSRSAGSVPRNGLTARLLRDKLRLGEVEVEARRVLRQDHDWWEGYDHWALTDPATNRPRRTHRTRAYDPAHRERFLAGIAELYVRACAEDPRRAVVNTMGALDRAGAPYTRDYVRDRIHEARERGLLTGPPRRGSAGGQLTPRALELLAGR